VAQADTNRPSFNAGGGLYTYLTTSEETGEQFSLLDVLLPPQAGPQLLQSNAQAADSFYVLDGEVTFQIGDQTTVGTPGTFVYLPQNTSYAYQNRGTTQARTLLLRTATRVP
jgi:quercetin dioxygenase-like cupin family protein